MRAQAARKRWSKDGQPDGNRKAKKRRLSTHSAKKDVRRLVQKIRSGELAYRDVAQKASKKQRLALKEEFGSFFFVTMVRNGTRSKSLDSDPLAQALGGGGSSSSDSGGAGSGVRGCVARDALLKHFEENKAHILQVVNANLKKELGVGAFRCGYLLT